MALAFDSTGSGFAFYRGQDNAVYMRTFRGNTWSAQRRIGGVIVGAPAAAVARTTVVVAARGTNNTLRLRMMHNGTWAGGPAGAVRCPHRQRSPAVGGRTYSAPAIGYIPQSNGEYILIRGTDGRLWANGFGGQTSTGWQRIGRKLMIGGPTAAGTREPTPHIIAAIRGTDHAVWTTVYPTGNGWSAFTRAWVPRG